MKCIRRHPRKIVAASILAIILTACGLVIRAGSEIASPTRRPVMDYHREFLSNQAAHGLRIDRFTASKGTPVLVCSPGATLGDRGAIIRRQLTARGLTLLPAGTVSGTLVLCHGRKGRKEDYLQHVSNR